MASLGPVEILVSLLQIVFRAVGGIPENNGQRVLAARMKSETRHPRHFRIRRKLHRRRPSDLSSRSALPEPEPLPAWLPPFAREAFEAGCMNSRPMLQPLDAMLQP